MRALLLMLLALGGCAAQVQAPPPPPPPEPAAWWRYLPDAALPALVEQALAASPEPAAAQARLAEARAARAAVAASARPTLGTEAGTERSRRALSAEERADPAASRRTTTQPRLALQARWELDLFGRRTLEAAEAEAHVAAAAHDGADARARLATAVVQRYTELASADAELLLAGEQRALRQAQLDARAALREAGRLSRRDTAADALALAAAEQAERDAAHQRRLLLAELARLCGQPPEAFSLQPAPTLLAAWPAPPPADLAALARRPEVLAAWQRLQARTAARDLARLERYPRLALNLGAGWASDSLRRWLRDDSRTWAAGVQASLPLLDGGRIDAAAAVAQAQADAAAADHRAAWLQALADAAAAALQDRQAREQARLADARLHRQAEALREAEQAQAAGRSAVLDTREAASALLTARSELLRAQTQAWAASVRLLQATSFPPP